jgi:leader peptidase (prepilin peptidase)/N-methyltransferase
VSLILVSLVMAFVFGAIIGSFLNVVIYRVPADLSIVSPGSRCPSCETPIAWYDNIPILSWLALGAQCRSCKTPIAWRYPAVEGATGFLSALLWLKIAGAAMADLTTFTPAPLLVDYALHMIFICLLVVIAMVDLDHLIIPHEFTLPGIVIGVASPFILLKLYNELGVLQTWPPVFPSTSIIGVFAGGGIIVAIFLIYLTIRGIPAVGGGDVTLMAMVGAWLGWPGVFFVLFAASIQGLIAAAFAHFTGVSFIRDAHDIFDEDEAAEAAAAADEAAETPDTAEGKAEGEAAGAEASAAVEGAQEGEASAPAEDAAAEGADAPVEAAPRKKPVVVVLEDERPERPMLPAIPFGPFIVLSTLEHYFLGEFLPEGISMAALYML